MLLEFAEEYLRAKGEEWAAKPSNPWRASAAGHCIRKSCFDLLGLKGRPLQPRRVAVLENGNMHHDYLSDLFKRAMGWRFVEGMDFKDTSFEMDGCRISFHIDGAWQQDNGEIGVVEFKSAADFSFDRAKRGEIEHQYLCQAFCYWRATTFNPVCFIFVRKETCAMVEVVFDRNATEKIVTQRLGQNPVELAKQDPLLITEITSPFDPSVEEYVRDRIWWLKETKKDHSIWPTKEKWVRELVPGADAVEDEVESCHGYAKLVDRATELNLNTEGFLTSDKVERSGSWYKFKTGRKVLGFPCSYCAHMERCFPTAELEIKGEKPVWVIP